MQNYNFDVNYHNIEKLFGNNPHNNWVLWGLKQLENGKFTKPPINPKTLGNAMSNNSQTWGNLQFTKQQQLKFKNTKNSKGIIIGGIGLMLPGTDFIFVDIDHCIKGHVNNVSKEALKIINLLNSYTEISPGMEGIRIIIKDNGSFDEFREKFKNTHYKNKNTHKGLEIYSTKDNRYCTFTGNMYYSNFNINTNMKIKEVYAAYMKNIYTNNTNNNQEKHNAASMYLDDYKIIEIASKAKNGNKFQSLYNEPGKPGNSESDLAFINMLAFYTQDHNQIKRIIKNSPRNRAKFTKHPTYLDNTIDNALRNLTVIYNHNYNSNNISKPKISQQPMNKSVDNLDLKNVKWDPDYVYVKFKNHLDENETMRLSEYFTEYSGDEKPKIDKMTVLPVEQNFECLLQHYNFQIKYNMIKMEYEVFKDGKYYDVLENVRSHIENLCLIQDLKTTDKRILSNLTLIGRKNKYNPWEEYLKDAYKYYLKNPDKDIFLKLADTIISDSEYKNKFLGKFLLQMINVGCSSDESMINSDYMLVLKGPQFIGKTTWLQNLLPDKLKYKYFLTGRSLDVNNKDSIMETVSNILIEMGEIATTFKKSDQEAMKNFITSPSDKFRLPYGAAAITVKRRVCLTATTNDNEFLKDLTGTRRYITIDCIDFDKDIKIDIDMLWGYMYSLYLKGISYKFDIEEVKKINEINNQYLNKPEKILLIEETWNLYPQEGKGEWLTAGEIFKELPANQVLLNKLTIGRELKKLNIQMIYDKHKKQNKYFVSKRFEEIEDLPINNIDINKEPF
jgi:hypothetical protein